MDESSGSFVVFFCHKRVEIVIFLAYTFRPTPVIQTYSNVMMSSCITKCWSVIRHYTGLTYIYINLLCHELCSKVKAWKFLTFCVFLISYVNQFCWCTYSTEFFIETCVYSFSYSYVFIQPNQAHDSRSCGYFKMTSSLHVGN